MFRFLFQNKTIIQVIIHPEPFNTRPITAFGKAYIRTGDGDQVATKEQLKYFTVESQSEINTHLLPSTYTIEDLDAESIKEYRKIIEEKVLLILILNLVIKIFIFNWCFQKRPIK